MKFVVAPQNEGKTSDLIELGKKLVKEHPEVGAQGEITVYFQVVPIQLNNRNMQFYVGQQNYNES